MFTFIISIFVVLIIITRVRGKADDHNTKAETFSDVTSRFKYANRLDEEFLPGLDEGIVSVSSEMTHGPNTAGYSRYVRTTFSFKRKFLFWNMNRRLRLNHCQYRAFHLAETDIFSKKIDLGFDVRGKELDWLELHEPLFVNVSNPQMFPNATLKHKCVVKAGKYIVEASSVIVYGLNTNDQYAIRKEATFLFKKKFLFWITTQKLRLNEDQMRALNSVFIAFTEESIARCLDTRLSEVQWCEERGIDPTDINNYKVDEDNEPVFLV